MDNRLFFKWLFLVLLTAACGCVVMVTLVMVYDNQLPINNLWLGIGALSFVISYSYLHKFVDNNFPK